MPGRLRFDNLDVTERPRVEQLIKALSAAAQDPQSRHQLTVSKRYYFAVFEGQISSHAGWYVICTDEEPLYVGTAKNLNSRLNTENGSRDQFANPKRSSDPERNFIKSFVASGVLGSLSVITIKETEICTSLNIKSPLTRRDRHNVEKVLNLFRQRIVQVGKQS